MLRDNLKYCEVLQYIARRCVLLRINAKFCEVLRNIMLRYFVKCWEYYEMLQNDL